eukprot:535429_1
MDSIFLKMCRSVSLIAPTSIFVNLKRLQQDAHAITLIPGQQQDAHEFIREFLVNFEICFLKETRHRNAWITETNLKQLTSRLLKHLTTSILMSTTQINSAFVTSEFRKHMTYLEYGLLSIISDNFAQQQIKQLLQNITTRTNDNIDRLDIAQIDSDSVLSMFAKSIQKITNGLNELNKTLKDRILSKKMVKRIWGGQLQSSIKCVKCHRFSNKIDPFYDISIKVKYNILDKTFQISSVKEGLRHFFRKQKLDKLNQYLCGYKDCNKKSLAIKQIQINKAPNVLMLHLKRFYVNKNNKRLKIDEFIEFKEILNMSNYFVNANGDVLYDLFAVLIHVGKSANFGHYYACVKLKSNLWKKVNNTIIDDVNLHNALKEKAYVLFYCKRK